LPCTHTAGELRNIELKNFTTNTYNINKVFGTVLLIWYSVTEIKSYLHILNKLESNGTLNSAHSHTQQGNP